jgi:hypothetical protein
MAVQVLHAVDDIPLAPPSGPDTGAAALAIVAAVHQRPIDLVRLAHETGRPGHARMTAELVPGPRRGNLLRGGSGLVGMRAAHLIENGSVLTNGSRFGISETERMSVRLHPSKRFQVLPVISGPVSAANRQDPR